MQNAQKNTTVKHQPSVLKPPCLSHPIVRNLPQDANRAALDVADIFFAPADMPNLDMAIKNANACLHLIASYFPESMELVKALLQGLQSYIEAKLATPPQEMAMVARKLQYPQWDLITRNVEKHSVEVKTLIGIELINAYLLQKTFPSKLAQQICKLAELESLTDGDTTWIGKKLAQALQALEKNVRSGLNGLSSEEARLNHIFNSYLMTQFGFGDEIGNQAAGGKTELLPADYLTLFAELRLKVENCDYGAALRCTAFCMGLSVPITELVPSTSTPN